MLIVQLSDLHLLPEGELWRGNIDTGRMAADAITRISTLTPTPELVILTGDLANRGTPGKGPKLKRGMVLALEPMINLGTWQVEVLEDHWTVVTLDRQLSAHFEHTVAVTRNGTEVLTA